MSIYGIMVTKHPKELKVLFLFAVFVGRWVASGNPFAGRLNHYHDIGIFDTMRACNANSTVPRS